MSYVTGYRFLFSVHQSMEVVSPIIEVIKCLWIPLKKQIGYLKHFHENVKDLCERVEDLEAKRASLEEAVSYFQGEEEINEAKRWIGQAIELEKEAKKIEQEAKDKKKCRCRVTKQARKKADIVGQHCLARELEKWAMPLLTPAVIEQPAPSIKGLSSVESIIFRVTAALDNENNKIIGVWGMGGIGKTTVVKILNNQLVGTQHFSKVIMVVVSKDVDIKRVQDDIANRLGKNDSSRASELRSRLKQERKFLIILDDLWDCLDLDTVGIPSNDSLKGSKIILTTRRQNVCRKMETQIDIKLDVLRDDESRRLFKEKAGNIVDDHAINATAREVLKECAGLPLAITTVGRALRGIGDPRVWDHALEQLRKSTPDDIEDMEAKVYMPIKLSYDFLRPELKPIFLFCCLHHDDYDIEIDWMIEKWMEEGFLEDMRGLEKTINKGHSWIEELKSSCFLLEGNEEGFVRMHDVVRDVGISIASKSEQIQTFSWVLGG